MKRTLLLCLAVLMTASQISAQYRDGSSYQDLYDSETVAAMKTHVRELSAASLEGRKAGSDGEKAAAEYVESKFKEYGVDLLSLSGGDLFGLKSESGDTLTSRNVVGYVQGYDKTLRNQYIVIGARLDNLGTMTMTVDGRKVEKVLYGANGNASGLAMLVELARMVQTNSLLFRRSVLFVAFGASLQTYAGAWYFLNRSFGDAANIDAMINLDMLGTGDKGFYAYTSSNADLNAVLRSLTGELQPIQPELTAAEPYPSDHRAFYSKEIPSVMFSTGRYPEHNTEKDTQALIDLAGQMMRIMAVGYIAMAITQTLGGTMRGCGNTVTPMWISIFTTVVLRVPVAYVLAYFTRSVEFPNGHPFALSISLLVSWTMGMIISVIAFRWGKTRKLIRSYMDAEEAKNFNF